MLSHLKLFNWWVLKDSMWNWSIGIWRMWSKTDNLSDAKFWETSEKQIKLSCCSLSILTKKPCFYLKAVHTFFSTMPGHNDCHGFRSSTVWNVNKFTIYIYYVFVLVTVVLMSRQSPSITESDIHTYIHSITMRLNMWSYRGIHQIHESYRWARIDKFLR